MKLQYALSLLLAAVASVSAGVIPKSTGSSNDLNLPAGGMTGYNGIAWGWLPDQDSSFTSMTTINGWTGKKASTYGTYAQIDDKGSFVGQLQNVKTDVVKSGAVWIPAVMPTISGGFSAVTDAHCQKVASIVQDFVNSGVEVWVRFGHEMNWYVTDGTYHGSASDFVAAWKRMHNALSNINGQGKVMMFWSPNAYGSAGVASLDQWYPGDNYVDIVGIDIYPSSGYTSFAAVYGDFYNRYSKGHNKHFAIGETGIGNGVDDVGNKEAWVKALANTDVSAYPFFKSATWFEYDKGGDDFRVIMGQSSSTITQTLSNFK